MKFSVLSIMIPPFLFKIPIVCPIAKKNLPHKKLLFKADPPPKKKKEEESAKNDQNTIHP